MEDRIAVQNRTLEELLRYQKKEAARARISMLTGLVMAAALVLALALVVPRTLSTLDHVEGSLAEVDAKVAEAGEMMTEIGGIVDGVSTMVEGAGGMVEDVGDMVTNTNTLLEQNTGNLTEAIAKLNGVDFDTLNQAIEDLADAVEPLGRLGRMFN